MTQADTTDNYCKCKQPDQQYAYRIIQPYCGKYTKHIEHSKIDYSKERKFD